MLACFPAGRGDPANRGRFVLKLSRSGINPYWVPSVSLLSAAYSLSPPPQIRGEQFLETVHSAVTGASYSESQQVLLSVPLYRFRLRPALLTGRQSPLTAASHNASPWLTM